MGEYQKQQIPLIQRRALPANDNFHLRLVCSNGRASETLRPLRKAYTYDQTGTGYGLGIGHLTSLTDAAGSLTRSYDERGNMLTSKRTNGANVYTTTYGFDPASRIASISYPSGSLVTNVYDTAGYLHLVKAKPTGSPITTTLATLTHLPFGPINSSSYGNGVSESWTFDEDYRSTNITDTHSATTLQNLTYGYDANDNVKTITDAVNAANGQTLGYDVLNRINSAVSGTGGYGSLSWTYDKNGNVKTFRVGSSTTTYGYTSGTNRLATIGGPAIPKTVSTNANGNITSIPPANSGTNATFSYGNDNRLASVTGSPVAASFVYDAFGQRFSKTDSGGTPVLYSYLQGQLLMEENNNGAISDYVYADGRPISVLKVGSGPTPVTSYILADRLGTPQLATSGSAATVWATTYQPYGTTGAITGTLTQNLRLPGQNNDSETGFYYNIHRDYMPNIGRYLETDPIGLGGGMNTYGYAGGNPTDLFDLTGTEFIFFGSVPPEIIAPLSESPLARPEPTGSPSPFLPEDPYSPESVSGRQSATREDFDLNKDPDTEIPPNPYPQNSPGDYPPGSSGDSFNPKYPSCTARPRSSHPEGQRNQGANEEHSVRPKGGPRGGRVGNGVVPVTPCPPGYVCT